MVPTVLAVMFAFPHLAWTGPQRKLRTLPQSQALSDMATNPTATLTIGRLARAADVGVETVRYYQERALLPIPTRVGGFRQYPRNLVERIRFIKRAQDLGFTLDEIADLLRLNDGTDRESIRTITAGKLDQIATKLADLTRMRGTLRHLLHECEHTDSAAPCPIIETLLAGTSQSPKPKGGK